MEAGCNDFIIKINKVSKVYGEGNTEVTALHPISLDVKAGEFIGIVGLDGKSTLLSIAGALLSPSKGDIYIREQNITQLSEMTDIRLKKSASFSSLQTLFHI